MTGQWDNSYCAICGIRFEKGITVWKIGKGRVHPGCARQYQYSIERNGIPKGWLDVETGLVSDQ